MTHTIDTLMAIVKPVLGEDGTVYQDLHAALTEAIPKETWTDDGGWTFEIDHPPYSPEVMPDTVEGYESMDVWTLRKWLNEGNTAPIDRVALARVLGMVQAAQPAMTDADLYANVAYSAGFVEGERAAIVAQSAPQRAQPVAQPFPEADLTGVSVCCGEYARCGRPCTPRGRWQAEQAQPVREPLTDDTIKGLSEDIWGCEIDYQHTWEIEFARAIERAHGIGSDV
jgi:hypothetical protein